ncbi:N-acetylaspartate synthetase [Dendropsophus ebraccatus]|uniref:N-acetylaspartate synthetase n=1 Tax=Dendropsophus ebraccatus TaxID=150705 RepID=UPI0038322864
MHFIPPKMVCESGILADDPSSIAGPQKDPLIVSSSQMWSSLATSPLVPTSSSTTTTSSTPADEDMMMVVMKKKEQQQQLYIREFEPSDQETARRIFYEGIKERIPSSAFRGLKYQPLLQCIYALLTLICFVVTNSLVLASCMPIILLGMRYYFSRKIILHHLECALRTDMSDIEQYYMKQPGSCFWVAVLEGKVVGIVAARGNKEDNIVELRRMSVDSNYRGKGIAKALGRKVLEFAMLNHYSSIVLGTTAVKIAAHKLYESLGFKHVGVVEHYTLPGMTHSLLERMFFQLRYHRYCLQLREE